MRVSKDRWWSELTLNTRCANALKKLDMVDSPLFKNDTPDDLREVLRDGRLTMLRNVGINTHIELCKIMNVDYEE